MIKERVDYHRLELAIARDPNDPRRAMPPIDARHRRILDVGCGAGQTLMACELPDDAVAAGVDLDFAALRLGREMNPRLGLINAAGEALPFSSETFDLVICRVALPYMHVTRAVREMARVLKVGGDLWLTLHPVRMTMQELGTNLSHLQAKAALYRLWVLMNGLTLHTLGRQWGWPTKRRRYETWQTESGMRRALSAAGFDQVSITRGTHFVVTATKARTQQ